jgi:putative Flp pilus-assembly TadE/G-like protein
MHALLHALFHELNRFRRDKSGNVVVIFMIALIPLLSAIGCAVDYTQAARIRSKLQSAADAASVASISQQSPGYLAAAAMTGNGTVTAGVNDANNVFNGNMNGTTGYTNLVITPTVTKTGIRLDSNVQFSADIPVVFMKVVGWQKLTVTGRSAASGALPPYLDFYLMLDVSGSMGLPSTDFEQGRLALVNPDNFGQYSGGCTLACHFAVKNVCGDSNQKYATNSYCLGYPYTRVSQTALTNLINMNSTPSVPKPKPGLPNSMVSGLPTSLNTDPTWGLPPVSSCPTDGTDACIQLRADAVGYAVTRLFITATDPTVVRVPNQFRIGLYPFIQHLYAYFALTSSINGSPTNSSTINYAAANLASQLDTNTNANLGSGGTHIDTALTEMNNLVTSVGDGSTSTNTQPFIFLVTDGAQDPQTKLLNQSGGWAGSNHATVIDPTKQCKTIKDRGIIISVLYIPYQPIQNPNHSFAGDEDGYANSNIPNIPPSLQGCASPGFFYTANSPTDITAALDAMFKQALITAHITY